MLLFRVTGSVTGDVFRLLADGLGTAESWYRDDDETGRAKPGMLSVPLRLHLFSFPLSSSYYSEEEFY